MADAIFEEPRLAEIYDELDPDRSDLDAYAAMAGEFGAESVLDVGCGTGTLACLLAGRGLEVIAVDPAAACLEVARRKSGADDVRWVHGDVTDPGPYLPPCRHTGGRPDRDVDRPDRRPGRPGFLPDELRVRP